LGQGIDTTKVKIKEKFLTYQKNLQRSENSPVEFPIDYVVGFFMVFLVTILIITVNLLIGHFLQNNIDAANDLSIYHVDVNAVLPEKSESLQYIVSIALYPLFILIFYPIVRRWICDVKKVKVSDFPVIVGLSLFILIIWCLLAKDKISFYLAPMTLSQNVPLLLLTLAVIILLLLIFTKYWSSKWIQVLYKGMSAVSLFFVLSIVFITCINTQFSEYTRNISFTAYFSSIAKVFLGQDLAIDFNTQYGFYPFFLTPIFKIVGLDVLKFTVLMGILLAGFYFKLFIILNDVIKSKAILLLSYFAIPGAWLWGQYLGSNYDPYFQFWPHRVIFPGLLLLFIWEYLRVGEIKKRYIKAFVFFLCSLAFIWNFETGFIVLLTWVLFLIWDAACDVKVIRSKEFLKKNIYIVFESILTVFLAVILLVAVAFSDSGKIPDLLTIFSYQTTFYGLGFFMLPMPAVHPWNIVLLVYVLGLYISIIYLFKKRSNPGSAFPIDLKKRKAMIFTLSILGFGLFTFYQGRSHDLNLLVTFWTAFSLIAIFADDLWVYLTLQLGLLKRGVSHDWTGIVITGLIFTCLFGVLFMFSYGTRRAYPKAIERVYSEYLTLRNVKAGSSNYYSDNIRFINTHSKPGDTVLILDQASVIYELDSKTITPLQMVSLSELVLKEDFQKILDYLNINKDIPVIISDKYLYYNDEIQAILREQYILTDDNGTLFLYNSR